MKFDAALYLNLTYGPAIAGLLWRLVAQALRSSMRPYDYEGESIEVVLDLDPCVAPVFEALSRARVPTDRDGGHMVPVVQFEYVPMWWNGVFECIVQFDSATAIQCRDSLIEGGLLDD